jgi:hypothetical protein
MASIITLPSLSNSSTVWVQYYQELKRNFGAKNAQSIWVYTWTNRGGVNSIANDNYLREKMKDYGVTVDTNGRGQIVDFADSIIDNVESVLKIGRTVLIATLIISVGGIAMLVFNIASQPFKAVDSALAIRTGGLSKIGGAK